MREGDQRLSAEVACTPRRGTPLRGHQHKLLLERRQRRECSLLEGLRHEGRLDLEPLQPAKQRIGRAGAKLYGHVGVSCVKCGQHRRQPDTCRTFERTKPQHAAHHAALHLLLGQLSHLQQSFGVNEQHAPLVGKVQATASASKQPDPQTLLALLDAGGDVRRNAVQPAGRTHHASLADDAAEDFQVVEIEHSHYEKYMSR